MGLGTGTGVEYNKSGSGTMVAERPGLGYQIPVRYIRAGTKPYNILLGATVIGK
jgi:hypothetical protein